MFQERERGRERETQRERERERERAGTRARESGLHLATLTWPFSAFLQLLANEIR